MYNNYSQAPLYSDYFYEDYSPRKNIKKAGMIGAGLGLATCAGLQYGTSEILRKNTGKLLNKAMHAVGDNKKGLAKFYSYLLNCAEQVNITTIKWTKVGVAGIIGATIFGLMAALNKAKENLP